MIRATFVANTKWSSAMKKLAATLLAVVLAALVPTPLAHADAEWGCVTRQLALGYSDPNVPVAQACDQVFLSELEQRMNEGLDPSAPEYCPQGYFTSRSDGVLAVAHNIGAVMARHPNLAQFKILVNNWYEGNQNKPDPWTPQQAVTFVMTAIHYFAPDGTEARLSAESSQN